MTQVLMRKYKYERSRNQLLLSSQGVLQDKVPTSTRMDPQIVRWAEQALRRLAPLFAVLKGQVNLLWSIFGPSSETAARDYRQESTSVQMFSQCPLCLDNVVIGATGTVKLDCGHHWCADCLDQNVRQAAMFRVKWPPRCCKDDITEENRPYTISRALTKQTIELLLSKEEELRSDDPTYCPKPGCCTFISTQYDAPRTQYTYCPKPECMTDVCKKCKSATELHIRDGPKGRLVCPDTFGLDNRKLITEGKMQRCPREGCATVLEKSEGCDHMTCEVCKTQFCYLCSKLLSAPLYQCPFGGGAPRFDPTVGWDLTAVLPVGSLAEITEVVTSIHGPRRNLELLFHTEIHTRSAMSDDGSARVEGLRRLWEVNILNMERRLIWIDPRTPSAIFKEDPWVLKDGRWDRQRGMVGGVWW